MWSLPFLPLLGNPGHPGSVGFFLQLGRSAGVFICKWSKWNFSQGSSVRKMKRKQLRAHGSSGNGKQPLAWRDL